MAKLNQRLSPSGPVIGDFGFGTGLIIQADTKDTIVTSGSLDVTAREIQTDMSAPASTHTMRPSMAQVSDKNYIQMEAGFDINLMDTWVTSTITTTLQVSRDAGATWFDIHEVTQTWWDVNPTTPVAQKGHIQLKTPHLDPNDITGFEDGDTLIGRVTVETPAVAGRATLDSPVADGTAYATLYELLRVD